MANERKNAGRTSVLWRDQQSKLSAHCYEACFQVCVKETATCSCERC